MIINDNFRPRNVLEYPPNNKQTFEEYFYDTYIVNDECNSIYLPIFWTNYYISKNYGKGDLSDLQIVLDRLDKTKKYFTIIQYDDNIINELNNLDILIFAQGGYGKYKDKSYPIPLNCQTNYINKNIKKNIFASFIGRKTHPIRDILFDKFKNQNNYLLSESMNYNSYKETMNRSIFSLCPRGYGLTSFRICEALQCESIPVYIYDDKFIPFVEQFDFESICILVNKNELSNLDDILKSKSQKEINNYVQLGKIFYKKYFDYYGAKNTILNIIKNNKDFTK